MTGVTVILCPDGVTAAAEVRGTATGTRQFDSLVAGQHVSSRAHAVVLAGGSAFGLSAADPVVDWLSSRGYGFQTGVSPVPRVRTAILSDLGFGDPAAGPAPRRGPGRGARLRGVPRRSGGGLALVPGVRLPDRGLGRAAGSDRHPLRPGLRGSCRPTGPQLGGAGARLGLPRGSGGGERWV